MKLSQKFLVSFGTAVGVFILDIIFKKVIGLFGKVSIEMSFGLYEFLMIFVITFIVLLFKK